MPRANAPQVVQQVRPVGVAHGRQPLQRWTCMVQSIECFHQKASFGDAELQALNTKILNANATTEDAERYPDLSYELSQTYLNLCLVDLLIRTEAKDIGKTRRCVASSFTTRPINTKSQPSDISAVKTLMHLRTL